MQSRTRYLIYSAAYDGWMNKMADGITVNMFAAIWFRTADEAGQWMQGNYAPRDPENYEIQETLTTMEVIENEHLSKVGRGTQNSPIHSESR